MKDYLESSNLLRGDFIRSTSGGTTETPVAFYLDRRAVLQRHAATFYFNSLLGFKPGHRAVYIWGAARDIPAYKGLRGYLVREWINRATFIPVTDLSESNMFSYYKMLRNMRPRLLQAYPSAIEIFADFLASHNLRLQMQAVTCTAETLSSTQRDKIRAIFGVNPIEWYGAREAGRIATECQEHSGMHINCYGLLVETTNVNGAGRILVTDLWNELMPIIRYELGDAGEIDNTICHCGSALPRLKNVLGRLSDNFVKPDGTIVPGLILNTCVPPATDEVRYQQVIQKSLQHVVLKIVPGRNFDHLATLQTLKDGMAAIMGKDVLVEVEIVAELEREKSGKLRTSKNEMPLEELRKHF